MPSVENVSHKLDYEENDKKGLHDKKTKERASMKKRPLKVFCAKNCRKASCEHFSKKPSLKRRIYWKRHEKNKNVFKMKTITDFRSISQK